MGKITGVLIRSLRKENQMLSLHGLPGLPSTCLFCILLLIKCTAQFIFGTLEIFLQLFASHYLFLYVSYLIITVITLRHLLIYVSINITK